MRTLATCLLASLFVVNVEPAFGDGLPPPPPKGLKYMNIDHEVILSKDVTGYVFVESVAGIRPGGKFRKLELNDKKPTTLTVPGRRTSTSIYAVPEKAAAAFKTDDELFKAIEAKKVEGSHHIRFRTTTTVKDTDKRERIKWTHTIQSIDATKGPTVKVEGDGQDAKSENLGVNGIESHYLIAALAFTLAMVFTGLWFARRK
jgi:hypothetical protein